MNTNSSHNTLKFHIIFENVFFILCALMYVHMCTMKGMWKFVCVCTCTPRRAYGSQRTTFGGGVSFLLPLWDQAQVIGLVFIFWATSLAIKIFYIN